MTLAVVKDLIMKSKIKLAYPDVIFVDTKKEFIRLIPQCTLLIIDLTFTEIDPLGLCAIARDVPTVGFTNHTNGELMRRARQVGCKVVTNSAFVQWLERAGPK